MDITIHTNPRYAHQVTQAEILKQGFKKYNIYPVVTASITRQSDYHIVLGCNYAKSYWLGHENIILVDRCYYHSTDNHVSVGWMNQQGGRNFFVGTGRKPPEIIPSYGKQSVFLADYNGVVEKADIVRLHPSNKRYSETLDKTLARCDRATGYNTTALVHAALRGLTITCKGKNSILKNENWYQLLPYANWSYTEIQNGELWQHLQLLLSLKTSL